MTMTDDDDDNAELLEGKKKMDVYIYILNVERRKNKKIKK